MIRELKPSKKRTEQDRAKLRDTVGMIIDSVVKNGDEALLGYNARFDGCLRKDLRISRQEIDEAYGKLSTEEIDDIKKAASNIRGFAKAQKATIGELSGFSPSPGIMLGHKAIPVDSCCCYIPGGGYPLYSTALMLGIPAKVAGVRRITACSPVVKGTEHIHPKTLVAMDIAGIDEIYAIGGAQAIAAFSYGTKQIRPVNLIVGPGNSFVTEAKRQCYGKVGIDFVAGPSEVLVIADGNADPEIIAADLLAQSEHDREAKGLVITTDEKLGRAIEAAEYMLDGYKQMMKVCGLAVEERYIKPADNTIEGGYLGAKKMIAEGPPDAIFATSDEIAYGVMDAIKDSGLSIPQDIAVAGFGNLRMSNLVEPKLTTMEVPFHKMGVYGARLLFDLIEGDENDKTREIVLQTKLRIRKSCGHKERIGEMF